jgi:hypothetical protein
VPSPLHAGSGTSFEVVRSDRSGSGCGCADEHGCHPINRFAVVSQAGSDDDSCELSKKG